MTPEPFDIEAQERSFTDSFRRQYPVVWWLTLIGPFVATAAVLALLGFVRSWEFSLKVVGTAVPTFFFFGRFIILGGSDPRMREAAEFLTRGELFAMVTWMDACVAFLLVFHAGFLYKIPRLGKVLASLREDGEFILKMHPWIRRVTFLGLVIFVTMPIAASGSVGGAIFGRLLGMSRPAALTAILAGSLIGNGMMFLGSGVLEKYIQKDDPLIIISGLVVVAGVIFLLNNRYRKMKQWHQARDAAAHSANPAPGAPPEEAARALGPPEAEQAATRR